MDSTKKAAVRAAVAGVKGGGWETVCDVCESRVEFETTFEGYCKGWYKVCADCAERREYLELYLHGERIY